MKAKLQLTQMAGIDLDFYLLEDGSKRISQGKIAEAVDKNESSSRRFLKSKHPNALQDKSYRVAVFNIEGLAVQINGARYVNLIDLETAFEYWVHQVSKGNQKALALILACGKEALEKRFDNAFSQLKSEKEYEKKAEFNFKKYKQSRDYLEFAHSSYQMACRLWGFNAAMVHNLITLYRCGKTASQLREEDLISGDSSIGLNHIADHQLLIDLADIKIAFARLQSGTADARVKKAIYKVMGKKFVLKNAEQQLVVA